MSRGASGQRSTAQSHHEWIVAAHSLLAKDGLPALRLGSLCGYLGVTTGSFYHTFDSWAEFTADLIEDWRDSQTICATQILTDNPNPSARISALPAIVGRIPHNTEASFRVWASLDPNARAAQMAIDTARLDLLEQTLASVVDPALATAGALSLLALLVGFQLQQPIRKPDELEWATAAVLSSLLL